MDDHLAHILEATDPYRVRDSQPTQWIDEDESDAQEVQRLMLPNRSTPGYSPTSMYDATPHHAQYGRMNSPPYEANYAGNMTPIAARFVNDYADEKASYEEATPQYRTEHSPAMNLPRRARQLAWPERTHLDYWWAQSRLGEMLRKHV